MDGKSVLLCDLDGSECPMQLQVRQALPDGPNHGKVAIQLWQANHQTVPFEEVGPGIPIPTKQSSGWAAYLDETAATQIAEGSENCDFVLRLTE